MKHYTVIFDGIDRSGKTSMRYYLGKMSGHRLITYDRGIISNMAWDIMMGRPVSFNAYDLEQWKDAVFVHLYVEKEDWEIRCKMTNEPVIDYETHMSAYEQMFDEFKKCGMHVLEYNTTQTTAYHISKDIMHYLDKLNGNSQS